MVYWTKELNAGVEAIVLEINPAGLALALPKKQQENQLQIVRGL